MVGKRFAMLYSSCRRCVLLGGLVVLVTSAGVVWADPSPREFYGKDFASAPQVANAPMRGEDVQKTSQQNQGANPADKSTSSDSGLVGPLDTNDSEAKAIAAMQRQGGLGERKKRDGLPATTLMLFVSSVDKQHLRSVLKKAIDVVKKDDAFLVTVFQIGDYRNVPEELAATLGRYGVSVVPLLAPPEDLAFTQSPAWVFQSKEGIQVVEGVVEIDQFYDSDGNFKEPENFVVSQTTVEPSELKK